MSGLTALQPEADAVHLLLLSRAWHSVDSASHWQQPNDLHFSFPKLWPLQNISRPVSWASSSSSPAFAVVVGFGDNVVDDITVVVLVVVVVVVVVAADGVAAATIIKNEFDNPLPQEDGLLIW